MLFLSIYCRTPGGESGRKDGTGGMGLRTVQYITENHNGELIIRSGNGAVGIKNKKATKFNFNNPFPGTQCYINLQPKSIDEMVLSVYN